MTHTKTSSSALDASLFAAEAFPEPETQKRTPRPRGDWKKMLLVAGLGILSWIATFVGMLELIEANMGSVDIGLKAAIAFSVAMLMLMIIWLLDQIFAPINGVIKLIYIAGYIFLTTISVGFGFGFYWKVLESRTEASRSAESAVTQVQSALHGAEARLSQLVTTLGALSTLSATKAQEEIATGRSCPNSRPGDGPRRRLREADATRFTFAESFVKQRIGVLKADVKALDTDLAKVVMQDASTFDATGTRNEFMRELGRKLDRTVTSYNAFRTDPQLKQFRADFADRAERTTFSDEKGGTFACPDPQLQTALRGAIVALDQLPDVTKPAIAAVEGPEATIEAFRRLLATMTGLLKFKLPPSADEIRDEQKRAIQSLEAGPAKPAGDEVAVGLGDRDWVPLMAAIFVDLCLLLVSISRPMNRFVRLETKMKEAQEWPVIEVLSKFHAIHVDETIRRTFEVLRHVVFNWRGVYYAAIPLNGGDGRGATREDNERAQLEAYLLNNLFTSFEREQIFKPVPVSMFTSKSIQNRLRQQRSKYADVEAFRIFKFNNGAWPEMILSAIMGAAKRVEAEQRRLRAIQQAEAERAAREQAEAERLAKRARRWRSFVDPLRRDPPALDDGLPDLGEVANDMTGKPGFEPSLEIEMPAPVAEPKVASAAEAKPQSAQDPMADVKRLIGELTETVRLQQEEISALRKPPQAEPAQRHEPFKQAVNGDGQGWMPGSRNGHHAPAATPSGVHNLDEIRFSGASPSGLQAHGTSAAPNGTDHVARPRFYHELPGANGRNGMPAATVIPMPPPAHLASPAMSHGALAAKLQEPAPVERPMLDALIEASLNRDVTPIAPIVTEVTPVEPIEEWAPAPGLDAHDEPRSPVSSLEDIQRFLDQSRQASHASQPPEHVDRSEGRFEDAHDIMPELPGGDDDHPTENAEVNVPMIAQWWTRKS